MPINAHTCREPHVHTLAKDKIILHGEPHVLPIDISPLGSPRGLIDVIYCDVRIVTS